VSMALRANSVRPPCGLKGNLSSCQDEENENTQCNMDTNDREQVDSAPVFSRGPSELFDTAPAFSRGISAPLSDFAAALSCLSALRQDHLLLESDTQDDYPTDVSSGLESWSSTDTEETSAEAFFVKEASFVKDFGYNASSCDAPDMAIEIHQDDPALRAWSEWAVYHPMGEVAYQRAAHRAPYQYANDTLSRQPTALSLANVPYNCCVPSSNETPLKDMHAGSKRLYPGEFLHHGIAFEAFAPRPKKRISSKRMESLQHFAAEAVAPFPAPAALSAALASDPGSFPFSPLVNSDSQLPSKKTMLQCCKFTSKHTQQACKGELTIVPHKRGHLAVSCSSRHQWVWCSACCNCHAGKGQRGCTVPTHWFERDAFDTGARNHMNVHKAGVNK